MIYTKLRLPLITAALLFMGGCGGSNTPDHGEIIFEHVFSTISELGYSAPVGAKYKPVGPTIDTLAWMSKYA